MPTLSTLQLFLSAVPSASHLDSSGPALYFLVPALLILYYLAARYWIRTHSTPGAVVTQYTPPQNLSPGALRYCFTGYFDAKAIASTVLHLAARGLVTFQGLDENYAILRTAEPLPPDLPREETAVYKKMFNLDQGGTAPFPGRFRTYQELPKDAFLLPATEGPDLLLLSKAIHASLSDENQNLYFSDHLLFSFFGSFFSLYFLFFHLDDMVQKWFFIFIFFPGIFVFTAFRGTPEFRPSLDPQYSARMLLLFILVIAAVTFGLLTAPDSYAFQFALPAVVILNLALPALLRSPTAEGRKLLDEIAGYRNFLSSVELDRMHRLKSPGWKPSQATANLAYALALDLGDAWEEYLANAGFRTSVWERGPAGSFPHKRELRTAADSAWVDHWSKWVAFAAMMLFLATGVSLVMRIISP